MRNLVSLRLLDPVLVAESANEMEDLAHEFCLHPSLKRITLDLCCPQEDTSVCLQPLIHAIADHDKVEHLALNNTPISPLDAPGKTRFWIKQLAESTSLQTLKLEMISEIQNEHVILLAQTLSGIAPGRQQPTNQTLQELRIESWNVKESGCTAIAEFLRGNHSLHRLELVVLESEEQRLPSNNDEGGDDDEDEESKEIDWNATGMADSLKHSTSLKYLRIFAENISAKGYPDAFRDVLQTNFSLEHLILGWEGDLSSETEFYLKLNRHGRKNLTANAPKEVWAAFLMDFSQDLSVLHYVLTLNPTLVQYDP